MLPVAVHHNDSSAPRLLESRAKGGLFPKIPAEPKAAHGRRSFSFLGYDRPGVVGRSIVHQDQFVGSANLIQHVANGSQERGQRRGFLKDRDDDRNEVAGYISHGTRPTAATVVAGTQRLIRARAPGRDKPSLAAIKPKGKACG